MPSCTPCPPAPGHAVPCFRLLPALTGSAAVLVGLLIAAAAPARAEDIRLQDKGPGLGGVEIVPADAAYFSATLRAREQYDLIVNSNAFATIMKLPGVVRGLGSLEEQRSTPGNPLAFVDGLLELPENKQALEVLADMVATDTFVYAEPSCIKVLRLVQKLQAAQQAVTLRLGGGAGGLGGIPGLPGGNDGEDGGGDDDDEEDEDDADEDETQVLAMLKAAAANLDLVVLPDIVWGFRITKPAAATAQLARLEALARFAAQTNPDLADAVARTKAAGGDFLTITIPAKLATRELDAMVTELGIDENAADGRAAAIDKLLKRLRGLDLVIAIGLVGDRVILSIGDSLDHLEKLALPGSGRKSLITQPALAPLLDRKGERLTGISYTSRELAEANGDPAASLGQFGPLLEQPQVAGNVSPEGRAELKKFVGRATTALAKRLPQPNASLAFSFLTKDGYEGYSWLWGNTLGLDGQAPLGLLSRLGGTPLAFAVSRFESDPAAFAELTALAGDGWGLFKNRVLPELDDEMQDKVEEFDEHMVPLVEKLAGILGTKFFPALADGQVGVVFDADAKTRRLQRDLPESAAPLSIPDLAIVLPLADAGRFREALSDLFELGDDWVAALRKMDPDAVPEGYQIPEPEKKKIDGGSVWSYALPQSGLDEQVRPAIAVGDKAAAFSLVPAHAARLLAESKLETGAGRIDAAKRLAGAAAADVPGIIDAIKPWVGYLVRYGIALQRDGEVDADRPLDGADDAPEVKEVLEHAAVILEAAKVLRGTTAETEQTPEATVTRWRNEIRDLPAPK